MSSRASPKARRKSKRSAEEEEKLREIWAAKGRRGLPPIKMRKRKKTQTGRPLRQLSKEDAYVYRKARLQFEL